MDLGASCSDLEFHLVNRISVFDICRLLELAYFRRVDGNMPRYEYDGEGEGGPEMLQGTEDFESITKSYISDEDDEDNSDNSDALMVSKRSKRGR
jgi:hypothetical protein